MLTADVHGMLICSPNEKRITEMTKFRSERSLLSSCDPIKKLISVALMELEHS
jgi:hypothetical protein